MERRLLKFLFYFLGFIFSLSIGHPRKDLISDYILGNRTIHKKGNLAKIGQGCFFASIPSIQLNNERLSH